MYWLRPPWQRYRGKADVWEPSGMEPPWMGSTGMEPPWMEPPRWGPSGTSPQGRSPHAWSLQGWSPRGPGHSAHGRRRESRGAEPRPEDQTRGSGRHVTEPYSLPSLPVARAEVNTCASSGRVFAFPLPSPQLAGRAHLRSGPGLCPGFPPSRAGRQGGRRRTSGPETSRKSGRRPFPSLTEVRSAGH